MMLAGISDSLAPMRRFLNAFLIETLPADRPPSVARASGRPAPGCRRYGRRHTGRRSRRRSGHLVDAAAHRGVVEHLAIGRFRLDLLGRRIGEFVILPESLVLLGEVHAVADIVDAVDIL